MMLNYFFVFLAAFFLASILIAFFKKLALKLNFVTSEGVTCLGGLGMWLAFILVTVASLKLYGCLTQAIWAITLSSGLIMAFGVIDDYKKELSVSLKFLVQLAATALLILFGIRTQIIYIGPYLNLLITFLWVLGITNAFNHLDIMDGLGGGIAVISSATFFLIALLQGNLSLAVLALSLSAVILGFLRYNLSSAKVYMGNSGSHFLGFVLAALAITISYAPLERKMALLSPMLILGLPIFDTSFLMLMRMKKGQSIFKKSTDHFALRLVARGYSQKRALIFMYLLGLFFSLSGLIISQVLNQTGIIILCLVVFVCLALGKKTAQSADK